MTSNTATPPTGKPATETPVYEGELLTEEELLAMPESEYMNEAQLAFFRHRLKEIEKSLVDNADKTTENLRETQFVPDPADRATIEEAGCTSRLIGA